MGGIAANRAQFGVTTLQDLVAERGAHVGAAFKKRAGKLKRQKRRELQWQASDTMMMMIQNPRLHLVDESPQWGEDLLEGGFRLIDSQKAEVDVKNFLH